MSLCFLMIEQDKDAKVKQDQSFFYNNHTLPLTPDHFPDQINIYQGYILKTNDAGTKKYPFGGIWCASE